MYDNGNIDWDKYSLIYIQDNTLILMNNLFDLIYIIISIEMIIIIMNISLFMMIFFILYRFERNEGLEDWLLLNLK